jgi:hypothetical protein
MPNGRESIYTRNMMCWYLNTRILFIVYNTLEVAVMPGNPVILPSVIILENRMYTEMNRSKYEVSAGRIEYIKF